MGHRILKKENFASDFRFDAIKLVYECTPIFINFYKYSNPMFWMVDFIRWFLQEFRQLRRPLSYMMFIAVKLNFINVLAWSFYFVLFIWLDFISPIHLGYAVLYSYVLPQPLIRDWFKTALVTFKPHGGFNLFTWVKTVLSIFIRDFNSIFCQR